LLLNPPEQYERQRTRLLVIGQQTNSWYNDWVREKRGTEAIDKLMEIYRDVFRLGLIVGTTFWQAVRSLERRLGVEAGAILWSNLNKVDENRARPSKDIENRILQVFPVLEQEINLAKPDVVVFFTGPEYEQLLTSAFRGADRVGAGLDLKVLARVRHRSLPAKTFRTYHPNYLRRARLTEPVLSRIASLCGEVA